jgi:23S rRNA (uracil1939-C5)-methyltransferase
MVLVVFTYVDEALQNGLLDHLSREFPYITSLLYTINTKRNDTFTGLEIVCHSGRDYIEESMEGLRFRISAKSFYQTNSAQAHVLYKVAREYAGLTGRENVYDLYTGTGTIALFVARQAGKVAGIDYVEDAIEDARINALNNGIANVEFAAGDLKETLNEDFIARHGQPYVVIVDPPRSGMHEDVVATLLRLHPERIVYVSCNPSTQARDIQMMDEAYSIAKMQAVDMFPHTTHVENVALLVRRG